MLDGKVYITHSLCTECCPKGSLFRCGFTKIFAGLQLLLYVNELLIKKKTPIGHF